jgi:hypothetical protein
MDRHDSQTDIRRDRLTDGLLTGDALQDITHLTEADLERFKAEVRQVLVMLRPRARAEIQSVRRIKHRAMVALNTISLSIQHHPGTGQSRRLVRFVAGCYNGDDYPFDLTDLRALDTALAQACLDYLDYDRLGVLEVHHHLSGGERMLQRWIHEYGVQMVSYLKE